MLLYSAKALTGAIMTKVQARKGRDEPSAIHAYASATWELPPFEAHHPWQKGSYNGRNVKWGK